MATITVLIMMIIATIIWAIKTYNSLQASKQSIIEEASNMQVSMQKRRDLASRILDIAQGFGDHEKLTHLKISSDQMASTNTLAALSQSFPELKANETYVQLMRQLEELENNISNKRESYNATVRAYNSYRSSFPTMLVANKLNFDTAPYYDAKNEDSINQLITFNRDDAEAVKQLINSSSESIKQSAKQLKESTSTHIEEALHSDIVKTAVTQGDFVMSKAIDAVKMKAKSNKEKAEHPSEDNESSDKN